MYIKIFCHLGDICPRIFALITALSKLSDISSIANIKTEYIVSSGAFG
ncbi:hypothetical protein FNFX1_0748 [Francisella cf. novicida Fx1]|nr:hypothetical protein FTA_1419 [Francisella tularensis subsp. holarctica FTNF002-00]AEB27696.1 hypothetical protein FNFX1_0748 [Francisella cf. novicida Fx1]